MAHVVSLADLVRHVRRRAALGIVPQQHVAPSSRILACPAMRRTMQRHAAERALAAGSRPVDHSRH